MKYHGMNLREAFLHVKSKREQIGPNEGFMKKLIEFDIQLFGKKSFDLSEYYVTLLCEMGFEEAKAKRALLKAEGHFDIALSNLLAGS